MKRILFSTLALAAVVVGCSKSDVVDAPNIDTPISFEAYSGRVPVSKATSIDDLADLSTEGGFVVYAYRTNKADNATTYDPDYTDLYMDCVNVTSDDEGKTWSYNDDTPIYWPNDGKPLYFVAYNDFGTTTEGEEGNETTTSNNNVSYDKNTAVLSISVPEDVLEQQDVLVADIEETKSANGMVENGVEEITLNFKHILSRVYFEVEADRELWIKDVKIHGSFYSEATYSLAYGVENRLTVGTTNPGYYSLIPASVTNDDGTVTNYYFDYSEDLLDTSCMIYGSQDGSSKANNYLMIIPATATSVDVTYQFQDEDVTYNINTPLSTTEGDFTLAAGKSYKFVLKMTSSTIGFKVEVDGWEDTTNPVTSTELNGTVTVVS